MDDFSTRLAQIQEKISASAKKAARAPADIELLAVSKTHPSESIQEAMRAGITLFGENKVQEARGKIEELGRGVWHLIGHLQSNKAALAVRLFDVIESVDRADLATELNRHADALGKVQKVLLQVNIAGEGTKFGCTPQAAQLLAETINALPRLSLTGLMAIPPFSPDPEKSRSYFSALRELRDKLEKKTGFQLPALSMGMSGDYEVAIEEGSTLVRIGTALFGERIKFKDRHFRTEDL